MSSTVEFTVSDSVAEVCLNRPDKLNAMNFDLFEGLSAAGQQAISDDSVRVVVVRGEGRAFSAGLDLTEQAALVNGWKSAMDHDDIVARAQAGFRVWSQLRKPVIAAVHGYAIGAGLQLALACDIRIARGDAIFSAAEITLGLIPDLGGTVHLARLCGPSITKQLCFTGRKFDGNEALKLGVIDEIVDDPVVRARELAAELASLSPTALAEAKTLVDSAFTQTIDAAFDSAGSSQAKLLSQLGSDS